MQHLLKTSVSLKAFSWVALIVANLFALGGVVFFS